MLVVAISVMLCVVVVLVTMHCLVYITESHPVQKQQSAKKLAQEVGISVREVVRCLEADVFLDKYLRWEPGGLHHPFLLQWMFAHVEATRQK